MQQELEDAWDRAADLEVECDLLKETQQEQEMKRTGNNADGKTWREVELERTMSLPTPNTSFVTIPTSLVLCCGLLGGAASWKAFSSAAALQPRLYGRSSHACIASVLEAMLPGPSKASQAFRKRGRRESWFVRICRWRIAVIFAVPVAVDSAAVGSVQDLGQANFSKAVTRPGLSFVDKSLKQTVVIVVKQVDAIAEKSLAQEHEVQSFPTLRLYRGSPQVAVKYEGPRTADKMAEWAKGKLTEKFADSFIGMEEHEVQGLKVNLYNFKQPARLSELQLPFKLLLLRSVDLTDTQLYEVPMKQAVDSWFPGFAWSILLCKRCQGRHLGWKFTPTSTTDGSAFYALIVEAAKEEELENHLLVTLRAVGRLGGSPDEIFSWAAKKSVAIVGLLDGIVESSMLFEVMEDVSFALNPKGAGGEVAVGIVETASPALLQGLGSGNQKLPCVALVRNFDFEEKVLFFNAEQSWKQSFGSLMSWIAKKRVPALIPGSEQTEKFFLQEIDPGNGLVLYFGVPGIFNTHELGLVLQV
eukprot:g15539.t1